MREKLLALPECSVFASHQLLFDSITSECLPSLDRSAVG